MKVRQKTKKCTNGFQTELTTSRLWRIFSGLPGWREQHGYAWLVKPQGTIAQQRQCQFGTIQQKPWILLFFNQSVQALIRPFFTLIPLEVLKPGLLIRYASCSGPNTTKTIAAHSISKSAAVATYNLFSERYRKRATIVPQVWMSRYKGGPPRQGQNTRKRNYHAPVV